MSEDVFGLTGDGIRRTAETNRRVLGRLPDVGRRTRRAPQSMRNGDGDGNGGSSGCACCGCLSCVDLCEQDATKVVTDCDQCPNGATKKVIVRLADVLGAYELTHTTGCNWTKTDISVTVDGVTGLYAVTYVAAGTLSTCQMSWVSGDDPLSLIGDVRIVKWKADPNREWSCLCNSVMIPAVAGERFPKGIAWNCEICISPKPETLSDDGCEWLSSRGLCISSIAFAGMDATGTGIESRGCDLTIVDGLSTQNYHACGGEPDATCCYSIPYTLRNPCPPDFATSGEVCVYAQVCVNDSTGELTATVIYIADFGTNVARYLYEATYSLGTAAVRGVNTLSYVSSFATNPSSLPDTDGTWPASLTVIVTDCSYSATNPDYGYGCGASSGGGGGTGCGGSCIYRAMDSTGTIKGHTRPWTWSLDEMSSNCVGTGCACPPPPDDPPDGPGAFFAAACVTA